MYKTHSCGELRATHANQKVILAGWVHRRRDHGGVIFLDLRDREGLVQVVFAPSRPETFALAETVRHEYVIQVKGHVRRRPEGTVNRDLATGEIEIDGIELTILNRADATP